MGVELGVVRRETLFGDKLGIKNFTMFYTIHNVTKVEQKSKVLNLHYQLQLNSIM